MHPSQPIAGPRRRTRGGWLPVLLLCLPAPAMAHALHLVRGEVHVTTDALEIALTLPRASLRHMAARRADRPSLEATLEDLRDRVAGGLIVRDAAGQVLPPPETATSWDPDAGHVSLRYRASGPLLVLRYVPPEQSGLREQLLLTCTTPAAATRVTLRLTSGGNPGYLQFAADHRARRLVRDRSALRTCAAFAADQPAGRTQIVLTTDAARPGALEVTLPLHLLDSWDWLPHADPDFITADEFERARERLRRELTTALGCDGPDVAATLTLPELEADRPCGVWTGRLHVRVRAAPGRTARIDLFNGRVQQVTLVARQAGDCRVRTLNSYAPEVRLPG